MTVPADPISTRNAANAQLSTGPRTAEGKAVSRENATVHGYCSVEPKSAEDRAEADAIHAMLAAELKPITPMELQAVRNAANADQRCRRIGRAIDDALEVTASRKCDDRQNQLIRDRDRCQADFDFWDNLIDHPPTPGKGLPTTDFDAILTRFGASSSPRHRRNGDMEDSRANLVRFHQGRAQGDHALLEALANRQDLKPGESLSEADQQAIARAEDGCDGLLDIFEQCHLHAKQLLADATHRLEQNEANPFRPSDQYDDSRFLQLLHRYQAEARRDYFRSIRELDAIRRRQDAERRQHEREQRQARKAAQDAEKAARQAARQAAINASANPRRNDLTAKVIEPLVPPSPSRNEPRSAIESPEVRNPNPVASTQPAPVPTSAAARMIDHRAHMAAIHGRPFVRRG